MDELSAEPTIRGFGKAIDDLLNGKSPSSDGIPPEMIEVIARVLITRRQALFPGCEIHHGHDFPCASVTPEVTRTGQAALSSLY